jgi:anti-sigma factor RsiW
MGIRCRDFVDLVTAFLDRALEADEERRFVEHLASCPGCWRYLDQMRAAVRMLRSLDPAPQHGGG